MIEGNFQDKYLEYLELTDDIHKSFKDLSSLEMMNEHSMENPNYHANKERIFENRREIYKFLKCLKNQHLQCRYEIEEHKNDKNIKIYNPHLITDGEYKEYKRINKL